MKSFNNNSSSSHDRSGHMGMMFTAAIVVLVSLGVALFLNNKTDLEPVKFNAETAPEITQDLSRAHTIHPRSAFMGRNRKNMVKVLNSHLIKDPELRTDECSHFTMEQLNVLGLNMWSLMDDRFNQVYVNANDNRRLRHESLSKMKSAWKSEKHMEKIDGSLAQTLLAKKCREMVMWYVHHMSKEAKVDFKVLGLVLPLLPEEDEHATRDDEKFDKLLSHNQKMKEAVEGDNANAMQGCVKCHVDAINNKHPNQRSPFTKHVFAKNEAVIYNPSVPCKRAVAESYALNKLAVTMVDELTYGFKSREQVRQSFLKAFKFPVKLVAEDVGPDKKKNFFEGLYNVTGLIDYYLKKGRERRSFHDPIFTYTSKCSRPEVVYNYKEIVEDHTSGGKRWKCVVFTTVRAVAVDGTFLIQEKMEKVGFL